MIPALLLGGLLTSPADLDAIAWPVYLDGARLMSQVDDQLAGWTACEGQAGSSSMSVELSLKTTGEVLEIGTEIELDPCWQARLESLRFSEHPEEELRFRLSLLIRDGVVLSILALNRVERDKMPPFIHLPASLSPSQRARIIRSLGLASSPAAE